MDGLLWVGQVVPAKVGGGWTGRPVCSHGQQQQQQWNDRKYAPYIQLSRPSPSLFALLLELLVFRVTMILSPPHARQQKPHEKRPSNGSAKRFFF